MDPRNNVSSFHGLQKDSKIISRSRKYRGKQDSCKIQRNSRIQVHEALMYNSSIGQFQVRRLRRKKKDSEDKDRFSLRKISIGSDRIGKK